MNIDEALRSGLTFEQAVAQHMAGTSADELLTAARAQFPELQHRRRGRERRFDDRRAGARSAVPTVVSPSLATEQPRPASPPPAAEPQSLVPEGFMEQHFPEVRERKAQHGRITWSDRS
jgi:hypothetical protein